jgi:hypothetical protein
MLSRAPSAVGISPLSNRWSDLLALMVIGLTFFNITPFFAFHASWQFSPKERSFRKLGKTWGDDPQKSRTVKDFCKHFGCPVRLGLLSFQNHKRPKGKASEIRLTRRRSSVRQGNARGAPGSDGALSEANLVCYGKVMVPWFHEHLGNEIARGSKFPFLALRGIRPTTSASMARSNRAESGGLAGENRTGIFPLNGAPH